MAPTDTSPKAREVYFHRQSASTSASLSGKPAIPLQRAAARQRYPGADDTEINFRIAVTRFGPDLARKAYRRE